MLENLINYIKHAEKIEPHTDRKAVLNELVNYIVAQRGGPVRLNFICTHNSRRSHLAMIWAAVAAHHYHIDAIQTYSGGTEATAFNPRAVAAIERAGFKVQHTGGDNPDYAVFYDEKAQPLSCFSKKYDHPSIGVLPFAAIMTCSDADENCPYIPAAAARIPIRYQDPKSADDTPEEAAVYDERCLQIASEMLYVFRKVKEILL